MPQRSNSACRPRVAESRLTPAAEQDLGTIWSHTCRAWSVEQANRYIDVLTADFAELAQWPRIARHVTTFGQAIVAAAWNATLSIFGLRLMA